MYSDGSPSPRLKARLDEAAELFRDGYFPKIIDSGGTGVEGVAEGTAMRDYLITEGIPRSAILIDDHGNDTRASAKNSLTIMRARNMKSILVITQYFHIPRSKLALSKLGVTEIYNSHPRFFELRDFYFILREMPAYLKYLMR